MSTNDYGLSEEFWDALVPNWVRHSAAAEGIENIPSEETIGKMKREWVPTMLAVQSIDRFSLGGVDSTKFTGGKALYADGCRLSDSMYTVMMAHQHGRIRMPRIEFGTPSSDRLGVPKIHAQILYPTAIDLGISEDRRVNWASLGLHQILMAYLDSALLPTFRSIQKNDPGSWGHDDKEAVH